jgi:hypothetical protein
MTDTTRPVPAPPLSAPDDLLPPELAAELANETCDACGSHDTWWRNCKLLCRGCGGIVKSCADL